jgi:hypothetical protein
MVYIRVFQAGTGDERSEFPSILGGESKTPPESDKINVLNGLVKNKFLPGRVKKTPEGKEMDLSAGSVFRSRNR